MALNATYESIAGGSNALRRGTNAVLEQVIRRRGPVASYMLAHPLLNLLMGKDNRVQGLTQEDLTASIITRQVELTAATAVPGVARADELTAISYRAENNDRAAWAVCHRRGGFTLKASERRLLMTPNGLDVLERRMKYLEEGWKLAMSNEMGGVGGQGNAGEARLCSIMFPINDANVYGGIDQNAGGATLWRGNIKNGGGASFTPDMLNTLRSAIGRRGGKIDLYLMSAPSGGIDIYNRMLETWRQAQHLEVVNGLLSFEINAVRGDNGVHYVEDFFLTPAANTAEVAAINLDSWMWIGDKTPQYLPAEPLAGTDAQEIIANSFSQLVCERPNYNGKLINVI